MYQFLVDKISWVLGSFHRNETIIWARIQMGIGAAWVALVSNTDSLAKIIENPKYLGYALMVIAGISEYLRRRGATFTHADDQPDTK